MQGQAPCSADAFPDGGRLENPSGRSSSNRTRSVGGSAEQRDEASVDDAYLISRAVEGYVDAFELLVQRHTGAVYRVALRMAGDSGDAQDITQETFLAAWQNLSRFRGDSAVSTWLYQIVTRRALNHVTRGRTRHATDLLADSTNGEGANGWDPRRDARHDDPADAARPAGDAVTAALLRLPPAQRTCVVLHYFERLPYLEIATLTGSSVPAVRSHLYRARASLANSLQTWR